MKEKIEEINKEIEQAPSKHKNDEKGLIQKLEGKFNCIKLREKKSNLKSIHYFTFRTEIEKNRHQKRCHTQGTLLQVQVLCA